MTLARPETVAAYDEALSASSGALRASVRVEWMMPRYFRVVNLDQYQHYKDRNPPWIKLHNTLLSSYEYGILPDASKAHLLMIWLLASRHNNLLPCDPRWIGERVQATGKVDLDRLIRSGFLAVIPDASTDASDLLAECLQDAPHGPRSEEKRREEDIRLERRGERERKVPRMTDADWLNGLKATPAYQGIDVDRETAKCAAWCEANRKAPPSRRRIINWLNRVERPVNGVRPKELRGMALIEARERQRQETGKDEV